MAAEIERGLEFAELVARFPLGPIADDATYRSAIAILDRLFALDKRRTPAELAYFRALARLARDYEVAFDSRLRPARIDGDGRSIIGVGILQ